MSKERDITVTNLDADETWLLPPGEPGSLMDLLIAAGTHRKVELAPGHVKVVPVDDVEVDEIIQVIRRVKP